MQTHEKHDTGGKIAFISSCVGLGASIIMAPLVRSLPERFSIIMFFALTFVAFVASSLGILLGASHIHGKQRPARSVIAIVVGILALITFLVNFLTPWLWPYSSNL